MDKRELQRLLSQPYKQENWKEIIEFVFPNVTIFSSPQSISISDERIKQFKHFGNVRLSDGKNLALFEAVLSENVNIQRNRVALNEIISKKIDQEQIHGVLSVFEQGGEDYRFTFSAKSSEFDEEESDFVQKKTDTKRYTYVLGKNESCKTPADRFYNLSENKSDVVIQDIQHAFSVEKLSKEFFEKYKKQFEKFWKYIAQDESLSKVFIATNEDANDKEKREVKIRDFTKKLLGRIVFLHFIQKKGWLGCPVGNEWTNGDNKFMHNLFNSYAEKDKFHSVCLAELFYNNLNLRRENDVFSCERLEGPLNNTKVPYLNGGLFDSDEVESRKIDFPESYFEELLDFFGQYNFTIDENDPNDHEVGIDPEMLGHIFENLLEDNKDKGAFYTPKVIVQYMCEESIIEYLKTELNNQNIDEINTAIEELIRNRNAEKSSDLDLIKGVSKCLHDVKVCDPAIGSGAFPMGILNVIYQVIEELWNVQQDTVARVWDISDSEWQPNLVKKDIIQNSIYGVDIESGAVDIARLRFWLALVVDEVEPLPLPNLDYKIMQGNSLLESFEGIDLSQISDAAAYETVYESEQIDMFTGEAKKKATISLNFEDVKVLMDDYFSANDPDVKKDLHKRIDEQVLNHIRYTLSQHKSDLLKRSEPLKKKIKDKLKALSSTLQKQKILTSSKEAKTLLKINTELKKYAEKEIALAKMTNSNERPFFLWHLFFQEVFEDGGFDIVIANPPYLDYREISKEIINSCTFPINTNTNRPNFYQYFIELTFSFLLKENGTLSFINPNQFLSTSNGFELREFILENTEIKSITDVSYIKVFKEASTYPIVWICNNSVQCNNIIRINRCNNLQNLQDLTFELNQDNLIKTERKTIPINKEFLLLINIETGLEKLKNIATLKWGTSATGYGKKKIRKSEYNLLSPQKQSLYKPILQTSDTKKYYIDWKLEYIPINIYSNIIIQEFEKEKILIGRVTKQIQACIDYKKRFVGKTTVITDSNISNKVLLAILNSRFINRWYYLNFETTHMAGGYLRYDIPYLNEIPIPKIDKNIGLELEDLVTKIIKIKSININTSTSNFEIKIDSLIYKLYDIDYSSIIEIDPDFRDMSTKLQFENLLNEIR